MFSLYAFGRFNRSSLRLFVSIFIFFVIAIGYVHDQLSSYANHFRKIVNNKSDAIESVINSDISDAKHILYGIASTISEYSLEHDNQKIIELFHNFNPKQNYDDDTSIPFSIITFINSEGEHVVNSDISSFQKMIQVREIFDGKICLNESAKEFFTIKASPIRMGTYNKENIIPLNMKLSDTKKNYMGLLCAGLIVREFEEKVNKLFGYHSKPGSIKIIDQNTVDMNHSTRLNSISISSILESYFFNRDIVIHRKLSKYPIWIEIRPSLFAFERIIHSYMVFAVILFIIFYLILKVIIQSERNFYQIPLGPIQKKLNDLNYIINSKNLSDSFQISQLSDQENFTPAKLAYEFNDLIDKYYSIYLDKLESDATVHHNEIKQKILNLILIEQHFTSAKKNDISQEKLYLNALSKLVNENLESISLKDFLEETCTYCSRFYDDIEINILIEKENKADLKVKHSTLSETIFNIFTFIMRGPFEVGTKPFIVRAEFNGEDSLPTIIIEAEPNNLNDALGWEVGPHQVYNSLISIYLLAKENKLFFNISKRENKICFILDPVIYRLESLSLTL